MDISALTGSGDGSTSAAQKSLAENFDNFLNLLTTQLRHQDPLSPTDSTEFTNQLVQFSQLEQQIKQSEQTDDLLAMQQTAETIAALGFLNTEIQIQSGVAVLKDGTTEFAYQMPEGASETRISIFNEAGELVTVLEGETDAGYHEVSWDGKDGNDVQLPDGVYAILVEATDAQEEPLGEIPVFFSGVVDGVTRRDGVTHLTIGPIDVPLDRVTSANTAPPEA